MTVYGRITTFLCVDSYLNEDDVVFLILECQVPTVNDNGVQSLFLSLSSKFSLSKGSVSGFLIN